MKIFTLENDFLTLTLGDLGASWLSCVVKMPTGNREVLLNTTPENVHNQTAYMGATIGRYANRIANGKYTLNGKRFQLAQNNGENNLHGGLVGADKKHWQAEQLNEQAVRFTTKFANLEEGFGGNVMTEVIYRLNQNQVEIEFNALSDEDTPLCFTNHAYFNLNGSGSILAHQLQINADYYLPVAENGIPNQPLTCVENTNFDFRKFKKIGQDFLKDNDQKAVKGYDHAFQLFAKNSLDQPACILKTEGLSLTLSTTMPALQLYTGNFLQGEPNRNGSEYQNQAGVALEPEFLPDTPNHPEWWEFGGIIRANEKYHHKINYLFEF